MQTQILEVIKKITPNNKITKGNIEKLRKYNYENRVDGKLTKFNCKLSDVISYCDSQLSKKANRRGTLSEQAIHIINFDFSKVAGCIGFEEEIMSI